VHPDNLITKLSADFHQRKAVTIFCKTLLCFTLFKIIFLWKICITIVAYQHFSWPRSWVGKIIFLPSVLAGDHLHIVYSAFLVLLIVGIIVPWNYFSAILHFWIVANLYRITLPITSGADQVHFMISLAMIGMAATPRACNARWQALQVIVYNVTVFTGQCIIVSIYLLSGWDKLITPSWRTGEAFRMIANLQYMIHPVVQPLLGNSTVNFILAWTTIVFELAFVMMVWFRKTRLPILGIGILFHLIIAVALNLYGFSLIMILSYMIFLKDEDYENILVPFKRTSRK